MAPWILSEREKSDFKLFRSLNAAWSRPVAQVLGALSIVLDSAVLPRTTFTHRWQTRLALVFFVLEDTHSFQAQVRHRLGTRRKGEKAPQADVLFNAPWPFWLDFLVGFLGWSYFELPFFEQNLFEQNLSHCQNFRRCNFRSEVNLFSISKWLILRLGWDNKVYELCGRCTTNYSFQWNAEHFLSLHKRVFLSQDNA